METKPIDKNDFQPEHPHDLLEKGRKYDALKKRNDELVEALLFMAVKLQGKTTVIMLSAIQNSTGMTYNEITDYIKEQALKNNEND